MVIVVVVEFVFMPMIRKALVICYTCIYIFHLVYTCRSIRTLFLFIHSHVLMVYTVNYVTKISELFTGDTPN